MKELIEIIEEDNYNLVGASANQVGRIFSMGSAAYLENLIFKSGGMGKNPPPHRKEK